MNALKNVFSKLKGGVKTKTGNNTILSNMNSVLYNKFVLYFILVLSLANLFFMVSANQYLFASIFVLVGFITSFFSKNMMVILCVAMVVTNVLKYGSKASVEGMENEDEDEDEDEKKDADSFVDSSKKDSSKTKLATKTSSEKEDDKPEGELNSKQSELISQYRELMGLQEKIVSSMQNINEPLSQAETLVNKMQENLKNMN